MSRRITQGHAPTFEAYRRAVDFAVQVKCGLSLDDLPDVCLIDWFDDGVRISTDMIPTISDITGGRCKSADACRTRFGPRALRLRVPAGSVEREC
jgi:hypothetical protein